jgi:hypothetical protein
MPPSRPRVSPGNLSASVRLLAKGKRPQHGDPTSAAANVMIRPTLAVGEHVEVIVIPLTVVGDSIRFGAVPRALAFRGALRISSIPQGLRKRDHGRLRPKGGVKVTEPRPQAATELVEQKLFDRACSGSELPHQPLPVWKQAFIR